MIISGAFGAFRKKDLRSIGDYDRDTLTEDFDNTLKFRKFGGSVPLAENAYSWTIVPDTWGSWVRQRMRWSRGQIETIWKHRNIIQQGNADKLLAASFIDMVFMDIILLFIRYSWLIFISIFKTEILPFFMILLIISYVVIESFVFIIAEVISPRKSDLKTFYIIPLTVLFYRPLHSIVRLAAYMSWILKRKITW
jgi:cellulose synthase/poly-beta-1,6-N-acetylglucosamine synthase-like glycosyltransferase